MCLSVRVCVCVCACGGKTRVRAEAILLTSSCGVRGSCPLLPLLSLSWLLVRATRERTIVKRGGVHLN